LAGVGLALAVSVCVCMFMCVCCMVTCMQVPILASHNYVGVSSYSNFSYVCFC
jgi:hypothetical protein